MRIPSLLAAAAAVCIAAPAMADPIDDAIAARQGYMKLIVMNFGPIAGMAQGKMDYDAEKAATLAANLEALTAMNNMALWPQGSSNADKPSATRALPAIWEAGSEVGAKNMALAEAVDALVEAAPNGVDALKGAVGQVGGACKGCHDDYRAAN